MRRLLAVLHGRNLEFLRDRSTLIFTLLLPVLLVIGMGFVFAGPERPLFKVGVLAPSIDREAHPFLRERYVEFIPLPQQPQALQKLTHQQIDLLVAHFLQCLRLLRQRNEFHVALTQEGVRGAVDSRCEHAHLEKRPLGSAEHKSHADHQQHRQQQGKGQRAAGDRHGICVRRTRAAAFQGGRARTEHRPRRAPLPE